jgi:acyl-CoA thioesterase-1
MRSFIPLCLLVLLRLPLSSSASTLVCLGDSITAGYGLGESEAYPAFLLSELPGWTIVNAGVSGDTSAGGLKRLDWILKSRPDAVFVALGGNDGLRGLKAAETEKNLDAIMGKIKVAGSRALLAGMLVPTSYGEDYFFEVKDLYPRAAKRAGVPLLPFLLEGVGGKAGLNQADGIHPTAEGQKILAKNIGKFLRKHLPRAAPGKPAAPKSKVIRSRKDL